MSIKLFILALSFFIIVVLVNVQSVFAITSPDFPVCSAPTGTLKVQYNEGTHGVIGNTAEFKGKDTVYTINESQTLQCLCTSDGQGIQTNWWKIPSLTDSEIQILKNSGWYYVPNGALWGLDSTPYMAANYSYSCSGQGGIGGGDVLSLAATGNKTVFYSLIIVGVGSIFIILGLLKRRLKHN